MHSPDVQFQYPQHPCGLAVAGCCDCVQSFDEALLGYLGFHVSGPAKSFSCSISGVTCRLVGFPI
jgi:hypothetical protein